MKQYCCKFPPSTKEHQCKQPKHWIGSIAADYAFNYKQAKIDTEQLVSMQNIFFKWMNMLLRYQHNSNNAAAVWCTILILMVITTMGSQALLWCSGKWTKKMMMKKSCLCKQCFFPKDQQVSILPAATTLTLNFDKFWVSMLDQYFWPLEENILSTSHDAFSTAHMFLFWFYSLQLCL